MNIAYFQRDERGDNDRYCRLVEHILADRTFPASLRGDVAAHLQRWGGLCQADRSTERIGLR